MWIRSIDADSCLRILMIETRDPEDSGRRPWNFHSQRFSPIFADCLPIFCRESFGNIEGPHRALNTGPPGGSMCDSKYAVPAALKAG